VHHPVQLKLVKTPTVFEASESLILILRPSKPSKESKDKKTPVYHIRFFNSENTESKCYERPTINVDRLKRTTKASQGQGNYDVKTRDLYNKT